MVSPGRHLATQRHCILVVTGLLLPLTWVSNLNTWIKSNMICIIRSMDSFCCWGSKTTHGEATFINVFLTIWLYKAFRWARRCKQTVPGICRNSFQTFREWQEKKFTTASMNKFLSFTNFYPTQTTIHHTARYLQIKSVCCKDSIVKAKRKSIVVPAFNIFYMGGP